MPEHPARPPWTPVRRPAAPSRRLLDAGWEMGRVEPGAPAPAHWQPIGSCKPVAAALEEAGQWSLDGPLRDFDAEAWWYRLRFDAPVDQGVAEDSDTACADWLLGLDGLATWAEVHFNGDDILQSRNMFRRHELPLTNMLPRGNELVLRFSALAQALAERRPRPRWRVPMIVHQQLRWHRTSLLGRTPGWSPAAAVVGPWRPVWLERRDRLHIAQTRLRSWIDTGREPISGRDPFGSDQAAQDCGRLSLQLRWAGGDPGPCRVRLQRGDWSLEQPLLPERGEAAILTAELSVRPLQRWWPHTHGEPALYVLSVVQPPSDGQATERVWPLGRIGFRTIEVDHRDGGFALQVNGVPVFCRGACWVPLDALHRVVPASRYAGLMALVREAGMNMVRVPGTMVYEGDAFFDACDAAGVLVWQDLMFASMDYPASDPAFADEVRHELTQQLSAWQARASLAVVCGNSEVAQQAAMWGAPQAAWAPALFAETLSAQVAAELPGVAYWPSSAHGGDFPFQPSAGTCSYYGVGAYRRPVEDARNSGLRFATECLAFANVPDAAALDRVPGLPIAAPQHAPAWKSRTPRDLGVGWDFDDVRNHYAEHLLGDRLDALRATDPLHELALARAASGWAMAEAYGQWRRADSVCQGALVWTLRDFRAGPGWGLLDEQDRPKAAWHALARVLQPLHLSLIDEGLNGLAAHLVNDHPVDVGGELEFTLYQHDEVRVDGGRVPVRLRAHARTRVPLIAALGHFFDAGWAYRFGPRPVTVAVVRWHLQSLEGGASAPAVRAPPAACWFAAGVLSRRRPDIGLTASSADAPTGAPVDADVHRRWIRVQSRAAAWGVHFESDGWQACDEFFHLPPGGEAVVAFEPTQTPRARAASPPWRVLLRALNTHQAVAVPEPAAVLVGGCAA